MNLEALRRAVADEIQDRVTGAINVYPYMPESPRFPCIVLAPGDPYKSSRRTMDDEPGYEVTLRVLVGTDGRAEDAQILLDELLSNDTTTSIEDALDAGGTFGGLVEDILPGAVTVFAPDPAAPQVFQASQSITFYVRR